MRILCIRLCMYKRFKLIATIKRVYSVVQLVYENKLESCDSRNENRFYSK